jgi:hypothetical protein
MSLARYYMALLATSAVTTPRLPPPPALQYLWNANSLSGSSVSAVPDSGTVGNQPLSSTGAPIGLVSVPELGVKAFNFQLGGDYFRSAGNFPVQKTNGPRTQYLAFRLDTDQSGDMSSLGQASYYGANFSLSFDGGEQLGRKILHLALAGMDMYPPVLAIGTWLTLAVRADPVDANTCRVTVLQGTEAPYVQDFRWLDTDFAPFRLGSGTWNNRAADMTLAVAGLNLRADDDKTFNNNLRQLQLACGLAARPLI